MCMKTRLPLNNLNTFTYAAEYLSFQKAAEALFVSPSAVSHQVRNLEQVLGYKLFDRLDKKVRLTHRGERLFNDIRIPIKEIHQAGIRASHSTDEKTLSLSVAPIIVTGWLLPRLKDFYLSHPEINLSVIATTDVVDFDIDPFDASIRMGTGDWPDLVSHLLFSREIVAVCHPSLLVANQDLLKCNEMSNYQQIHNSSMPKLWHQWLTSANVGVSSTEESKLEVQNSAQVVEVLQSGNSIGLIDRNLINNDIQSGRLAIACEHVFESEEGYFLTSPKSAESLVSFQLFKEWLTSQLP